MSATLTAEAYIAAFTRERLQAYPQIYAIESACGYALPLTRLESAARVLACPVKKSPPNWQHGRVIYAVTRQYLAGINEISPVFLLDVGTAKGFSALCLYWAMCDAAIEGRVVSVDVLDPRERVSRNTIAEVDGLKSLAEILEPWPEAQQISFHKSTGQKWLQEHTERVHVAFIDGKHSYEAVSWEAALLAERQRSGDIAIFDDVQIEGVGKALKELSSYDLEYVQVLPTRKYAIGRRK